MNWKSRSRPFVLLGSLLSLSLSGCSGTGPTQLQIKLGIPVKPSEHTSRIESDLLSQANLIPGQECRQNQVSIALRNEETGQIFGAQKIKLISKINPAPFQYNNSQADLDTVINFLKNSNTSYVEEEPTVFTPSNQKTSLFLAGVMMKPVDVNGDQICDEEDFTQRERYPTKETNLPILRAGHTATLLTGGPHAGKILVTGGFSATYSPSVPTPSSPSDTAVLFDPVQKTWTPTSGNMTAARAFHTATALPNGKVVLIGGTNGTDALYSIEEFDSTTLQFTNKANMPFSRYHHTATRLINGNILITGGIGNALWGNTTQIHNSYQLYNPPAGNFVNLGASGSPLVFYKTFPTGFFGVSHHTATELNDGRVLIAFGRINIPGLSINALTTNQSILYKPDVSPSGEGSWQMITTPTIITSRMYHVPLLIPDGTVIITGGMGNQTSYPNPGPALGQNVRFTPNSNGIGGSWSDSLPMFTNARFGHSAAILPGGDILVAGGEFSNGNGSYTLMNTVEIMKGNLSGILSPAPASLSSNLKNRSTVTLPNGTVVLMGGNSDPAFSTITPSDEVYFINTNFKATQGTSLSGRTLITDQEKTSGLVNLNINVLHTNLTNSNYSVAIANNPAKFKDWIDIQSTNFNASVNGTVVGVAKLKRVILLSEGGVPLLNFKVDRGGLAGTANFYIPRSFPLAAEFAYNAAGQGCTLNISSCFGRFIATLNQAKPNGDGINANYILNTGSSGNLPISTISTSITYPFIVKTYP